MAAIDHLAGTVRQELDGLPARAIRDVARQPELRLEVTASLARIAEVLRVAARLVAGAGELPGYSNDADTELAAPAARGGRSGTERVGLCQNEQEGPRRASSDPQ